MDQSHLQPFLRQSRFDGRYVNHAYGVVGVRRSQKQLLRHLQPYVHDAEPYLFDRQQHSRYFCFDPNLDLSAKVPRASSEHGRGQGVTGDELHYFHRNLSFSAHHTDLPADSAQVYKSDLLQVS